MVQVTCSLSWLRPMIALTAGLVVLLFEEPHHPHLSISHWCVTENWLCFSVDALQCAFILPCSNVLRHHVMRIIESSVAK